MQLISALLVLLACESAQSRRARERGRPRGRRLVIDCTEYMDNNQKYLDCQDRRIISIPTRWSENPEPTSLLPTEHLLLAGNKIQVLRAKAFAKFQHLKSLDLQQNELSMIEEDAFSGLEQLTTLLMQHNHLQALTEETLLPLPRLRYLRLYDNPWDCSCQLESLVRMLQLPSNRHLGNYAKCAEPSNLSGLRLKQVVPELLCPELGGEVTPRGAEVREAGSLQSQPDATSICHTYMFPRPLLDCRKRDLKSIPVDIPPDIVKIDLSHNNIKHLRAKGFLAAKDLQYLNLSSNRLESIDTASFSGLLHLRELDLSNNSLHWVQYGVLEDLYFMRGLALGSNPWVCDYNIHYMVYWLKLHPGVDHKGLICSEPPEFADWPVHDYVKTYNDDCPKERLLVEGGEEQEARAMTDQEDADQLPSPLREAKKLFEIIRLS